MGAEPPRGGPREAASGVPDSAWRWCPGVAHPDTVPGGPGPGAAAGPQQAGARATILRSEGMTRTVRTALPAVWTISIG